MDPIALDFAGDERRVTGGVDALNTWLRGRGIRSELGAETEPPIPQLFGAVRDLLQAAARGERPPQDAVDVVNAASAGAPTAPQLHWPADRPPRVWETTAAAPQQHVQGLIARSAMELVTLGGPERLRTCAAPRCERLFITANQRRRWCSDTCGTRERVARHAARRKARD